MANDRGINEHPGSLADLSNLLDSSTSNSFPNETGDLRQDTLIKQYHRLECELNKLKKSFRKATFEEEKSQVKQNHVFENFRTRTAIAHNLIDEKLLDIIDTYEKKLDVMEKELEQARCQANSKLPDSLEDVSSKIKNLIQTYEGELSEAENRLRSLEKQNELLKLEMSSRPDLKELSVAKQQIKRLEQLLTYHSIRTPQERLSTDHSSTHTFSSKVFDLDSLPLSVSRRYLKDVCEELTLTDLQRLVPYIRKLKHDLKKASKYKQFSREVCEVIQRVTGNSKPSYVIASLSETEMHQNLVTLKQWKENINSLPNLAVSINMMAAKTSPWCNIEVFPDDSVSHMISALNKAVCAEPHKNIKNKNASKAVLENIVQHFQLLFDVPSLSGVYPRMNEVYTKLGESQNVLKILKNLLGLSEDAMARKVVDAVDNVCHTYNTTTVQQLKQLLQTEDLDGIIRRLEEHHCFFPAFREVMDQLFDILELSSMDDIVPAVHKLKMLT